MQDSSLKYGRGVHTLAAATCDVALSMICASRGPIARDEPLQVRSSRRGVWCREQVVGIFPQRVSARMSLRRYNRGVLCTYVLTRV